MPHINIVTTLEEIKESQPDTIWYAFHTCWWTHREEDLRTLENGLPCDPRGSVLMMRSADSFFAAAEANPSHYGINGLKALEAAHNDNCVVGRFDPRQTSLRTWGEYNALLGGPKDA